MALTLSRASLRSVREGLFSDTSLVIWVMVFQNLLRIVSSMTLTRMLDAEAFAIVGVIVSVGVTIGLISDIGIGAFIVRHERTHEPEFRDELWTLRLIRGLVLFVLTAVLAWPVSQLLGKPQLAGAIAVFGLIFLFDGLQSLAPIVALRSRRLKRITAIDVGSNVLGLGISIGLAAWLHSYWAIILSNTIAQIIGVIYSYTLYGASRQRWRFSRERAAELWQFSRFITGSTILTLLITQGDKFILTGVLTLSEMGLYVIATGLAAAPAGVVGAYAGRVIYPLFAEIRREAPETLPWRFYRDRLAVSVLYAFAAGGLIGVAPAVIAILYDPRYLDAGLYLQIVSISTFFVLSNSAANEVMIALGHSRFTFFTNVIRLVYLVAVGTAGWLTLGPIGIVWAIGTVEVVAQLFGWYTLRRHGLLHVPYEAMFLLAGVAGYGIGYAVELFARLELGLG